jgi:hypothetical protein
MEVKWFTKIDSYLKYAPPAWRSGISYRLDNVKDGNAVGLANRYVHKNIGDTGIMLDEVGQIANICQHARAHRVEPRTALVAIHRTINRLGEGASVYQRRTLYNVQSALKHLK